MEPGRRWRLFYEFIAGSNFFCSPVRLTTTMATHGVAATAIPWKTAGSIAQLVMATIDVVRTIADGVFFWNSTAPFVYVSLVLR